MGASCSRHCASLWARVRRRLEEANLLERTPTSPLSGDICMPTAAAPAPAAASHHHRDRPRPPALPPVVSFYKKVGHTARARARASQNDETVAAQERMDMRDHDY